MRRPRHRRFRISVGIDPEVHDRALQAAEKTGLSFQDWCERALMDFAWRELRRLHYAEGEALRQMARGPHRA